MILEVFYQARVILTSLIMNPTLATTEEIPGSRGFFFVYNRTERLTGFILLPILLTVTLLIIGFTHYVLATCSTTRQQNLIIFFRILTVLNGLVFISEFIDVALEMTQTISPAIICWIRPMLNHMFPFPTILIYMSLHLDRLLMFFKPLRYVTLASPQRVKMVLVFISAISLLYFVTFLPIPGFPFTCYFLSFSSINGTLQNTSTIDTRIKIRSLAFISPFYLSIVLLTISSVCISILSFKQAVRIQREFRRINQQGDGGVHGGAPPVSRVKGVVTVIVSTMGFYLQFGFSLLRIENETNFKSTPLALVIASLQQIFGWLGTIAIVITNRELRQRARIVLKDLFL
ncbi:uncharacterized protein LOC121409649 [Lytechinus variegatus]|uniref:uncharacterized protein LOC121409649 n=1 Tax=Lytechinus variegatus TaxID=7654 RepID=UPI001BB0F292|nr:uncharacterized protein LOC121409649 [Lytechinus variegatus]